MVIFMLNKRGFMLMESIYLFIIACFITILISNLIILCNTYNSCNTKIENTEDILREIYN